MTTSQAAGIDPELLELIYDIPLRAANRPDRLPGTPPPVLPVLSPVPATRRVAVGPPTASAATAQAVPVTPVCGGPDHALSSPRSGDARWSATPSATPSAAARMDSRCDWAPVLVRLRSLLHADGSVLMTAGADRVQKLDLQGHDDGAWQAYAGHFYRLDPFLLALNDGRLPVGRVYSVDDLVPRAMLVNGEYFNDFWRPNAIAHEAGAFCVDAGSGVYLHLALPRAASAGRYRSGELAQLGTYINHLFRALRLYAALSPPVEPDLDDFARRYRLTPAELRLLETLRQTGTLTSAAARLGRRHNTVRAQLRAIFAKTDTHSQVALMTLLHRS